jgi:hypothetical protein
MTQNFPVLTALGSDTVPKTGTTPDYWIGYLIDRMTAAQRYNILYTRRRESTTTGQYSIAVDATGGTWSVVINSVTLAGLGHNIGASALQAAVDGMTGVAVGDITVSGGPGASGGATPYKLTLEPNGFLYGQLVPTCTTVASSLTGGAGTAAVTAVMASALM